MTVTCQQITEQASELLDGELDPGARRALDAHLATCAGCRAFVAQVDATRLALGRLPPPAVPAALRDGVLARFDALAADAPESRAAEERDGAGRIRAWAIAGVVAVGGFLVVAGQHASLAGADLAVATGLAAAALAMAATVPRFGARHAALGVAAAGAAAMASSSGGPLDVGEGAVCLGAELAGAAAVGLLAWSAGRRGSPGQARRALAGGAVAGALAAAAGLQLTCGAHLALAHVAVFHVVGVAVVAAIAARVAGAPPPVAGVA